MELFYWMGGRKRQTQDRRKATQEACDEDWYQRVLQAREGELKELRWLLQKLRPMFEKLVAHHPAERVLGKQKLRQQAAFILLHFLQEGLLDPENPDWIGQVRQRMYLELNEMLAQTPQGQQYVHRSMPLAQLRGARHPRKPYRLRGTGLARELRVAEEPLWAMWWDIRQKAGKDAIKNFKGL